MFFCSPDMIDPSVHIVHLYIYIYVRPCANVRRLQGTAKVLLNLPGLGELCVRPTRKALESRWWQLQNFCQGFGLLMGRQRTAIGSLFSERAGATQVACFLSMASS